MTDKPFSFWSEDWLAFQRNYMEALSAFGSQSGPSSGVERETISAAPAMNAWAQALDHWWKTMAPGANPPVRDFYDRLVDQGRAYFEMTEQLNNAFRASNEAGQSALRWREAMEKALTGMKEAFAGGGGRKATAAWDLPMENWQRMVSSMSVLPGDVLQGVNLPGRGAVGLGAMDDLQQRLDQFLSTPAVGHLRELQEQSQDLTRLVLDYQQAVQDYARALSEIGLKCIERAQARLTERSEDDEPLTSLRAVYDFWVDSCEEAYAEYVVSDEYIAIHGRLVNSLMALKRHGQMLVDEAQGALDMPTRREIDTMQKRFQELRREGHAVRAELNAMREQLATAEKDRRTAAQPPRGTSPKRTAPDKSTSPRSAKSSSKQTTSKQTTKKAAPKKKRARRATGRS